VTLDEVVPMLIGEMYVLRTQSASTISLFNLTNVPGDSNTVTLAAPVAVADGPKVGDHCIFGLAGLETLPAVVTGIAVRQGKDGHITAIPYAPDLLTDGGVIPAFDPRITPRLLAEPVFGTAVPPTINKIVNDNVLDSVLNEIDARATGDMTLTASLSSESSARIAADSAEAATRASADATLTSSISTVSADVTTETAARVSGDAANASAITSLTTTVSGHTASISSLLSSVSGIEAEWGIEIDINGNVVGLVKMDGTGGTSDFIVVANNFYVYDTVNGNRPAFSISGGIARFNIPLAATTVDATNIIANNIIVTGHLVANSVSNQITASWSGTIGTVGGTVVLSFNPTVNGGDLLVQLTDQFTRAGGHSPVVTYEVWRSYNVGHFIGEVQVGGSGVAFDMPVAMSALDTEGVSGTIQIDVVAQSNDANVTSNNLVVTVTELKR
jgi:hypothetical protein